ncbi:MAG: CooT family nickel-binding protein [Candidatus Altarchaeum sp.]|nr:CooT family nickel-binding protein [Candidatus Altarchaeum sp.]
MCESEIYVIHKGNEIMEKFMDEVVFVNIDDDKIRFGKMFEEEKELIGYKIVAIDLLNHRILIEKNLDL